MFSNERSMKNGMNEMNPYTNNGANEIHVR